LNFDVQVFSEAAKFLDSEGFSVVRLGTKTANVVNYDSFVIDYANSSLRTETADLQLVNECSFVISTQTGPDALALALRKPVLYIDTLRISQFFLGSRLATWNPVRFTSRVSGAVLSLRELLDSDFVWMEDPDLFLHSGYEFGRSSPIEIRELVASYLLEFRGEAPQEWSEMRALANSLMTQRLGSRGQSVWGDVTAQLNGYWLEQNHDWFLAD